MNIAVIDLYPILRKGLRLFLENTLTMVNVSEYETIWHFSDLNYNSRPDLLIVSLSQTSAIENFDIINFLNNNYNMNSIIFYDEETDFVRMREYFNCGVYNYLSKKSSPDELKRCLSNAIDFLTYGGRDIFSEERRELLSQKRTMSKKVVLTQNESQIAQYLCEGLSTSQISKKMERSPSSISTTKSRIFRKMSVDNIISLRNLLRSQ